MDPNSHESNPRGTKPAPYLDPAEGRKGPADPATGRGGRIGAVPGSGADAAAASQRPLGRPDESGAVAAPDPGWQPRIIAFFCNWCTYTAADLAGVSRLKYEPNVSVIRLMCSGRADPQFILEAFARGADGVLLGGCHIGDCHYAEGNFKALRRTALLQRVLRDLGIEEQRLRLEWISASEGERVKTTINEMVGQIRALGPLRLPGRIAAWDEELAAATDAPTPDGHFAAAPSP